ncbi:GDSL-like Lipase/Acylhydrolase-domain-containing protein [Gongronella butleri]|nr:GDSL-like Lipase/Acylhydrolase-domain-containing protein [Gongronella butleri]
MPLLSSMKKHFIFLWPWLMFALPPVAVAHFDVPCQNDTQVYPTNTTINPCFATQFRDIFIFGDSYTDNGPRPLTESDYKSNNFSQLRNTNGPVTLEYFAKYMGVNLHNYANSGATIDNKISPRKTGDAHDQYQAFKQDGKMTASGSTAYVFWFGVNDIHDIFTHHVQIERPYLVKKTLESLRSVLEDVYMGNTGSLSARYFVLFGLIPIEHMPILANSFQEGRTRRQLDNLIHAFNEGLKKVGQSLTAEHPDARVLFYDLHEFVAQQFDAPSPFKVLNRPCTALNFTCTDPDKHFWWDEWHPTTAANKLMALDAIQKLHKPNEDKASDF